MLKYLVISLNVCFPLLSIHLVFWRSYDCNFIYKIWFLFYSCLSSAAYYLQPPKKEMSIKQCFPEVKFAKLVSDSTLYHRKFLVEWRQKYHIQLLFRFRPLLDHLQAISTCYFVTLKMTLTSVIEKGWYFIFMTSIH